mmetsp:Transcript_2857/g.9405  ORF Transcript_2857/g.9405 Transcript_2857/m.9405 type:complete len:247 (-) Transcript_2857:2577-3317(-)
MQERASSETAIVQLNGKYTCASLERLPTPCDEDECLYALSASGYKEVEFATSRESRLSSLVRPCAPRAHAFQCKCHHVIFSSGARRITALTHDMRDASPRAQSVVQSMKRADVRRFRQPFAPRHHAAINHPSTQAYSVHFQAPLLKRITRRRNHNSTQAHGELFAPRPSPVGVFLKTLQVQPHSTLSVLAHDVIDDAFNTLASRLNRSRSVRPCVEDVRNESQLRSGALLCAPLNVFGESSKRFDR